MQTHKLRLFPGVLVALVIASALSGCGGGSVEPTSRTISSDSQITTTDPAETAAPAETADAAKAAEEAAAAEAATMAEAAEEEAANVAAAAEEAATLAETQGEEQAAAAEAATLAKAASEAKTATAARPKKAAADVPPADEFDTDYARQVTADLVDDIATGDERFLDQPEIGASTTMDFLSADMRRLLDAGIPPVANKAHYSALVATLEDFYAKASDQLPDDVMEAAATYTVARNATSELLSLLNPVLGTNYALAKWSFM